MDCDMSSIAAGNTLTTALVATGDTSGELVFKTNGSNTAITVDTSGNTSITGGLTFNNGQAAASKNLALVYSLVWRK
jgi:hypothetical protein